LVEDLTSVKKSLDNVEQIVTLLKQFSVDLTEHLKLEDDTFYPELLKGMKEKGTDTTKTEQFIDEMKEIGKSVGVFLDKYLVLENVKNNEDVFVKDLDSLISTLALRIESEEAGVYSYWGLF